jgi:GTP cyclohydrolase I
MINISWDTVFEALKLVDLPENTVYGVPKGGMIAAGFLKHAKRTWKPEDANIILDDLVDSGATKAKYEQRFPSAKFVALVEKQNNDWIVFPWEADHPAAEAQTDSVQENIVRLIQFIGDDPNREGLKETPNRIARAWQNELFVGYSQNPKDILITFEGEGYDQIILSKNIEIFSMCEHHMLPFFGVAHVAYIPNGRVVGISKLARLVDIYARRLQIQERIGKQVTDALMEYLQPKGAACIIEASHMCMRMRGVSKQQSSMVTSSIKGAFFDDPRAREELLELIRG